MAKPRDLRAVLLKDVRQHVAIGPDLGQIEGVLLSPIPVLHDPAPARQPPPAVVVVGGDWTNERSIEYFIATITSSASGEFSSEDVGVHVDFSAVTAVRGEDRRDPGAAERLDSDAPEMRVGLLLETRSWMDRVREVGTSRSVMPTTPVERVRRQPPPDLPQVVWRRRVANERSLVFHDDRNGVDVDGVRRLAISADVAALLPNLLLDTAALPQLLDVLANLAANSLARVLLARAIDAPIAHQGLLRDHASRHAAPRLPP